MTTTTFPTDQKATGPEKKGRSTSPRKSALPESKTAEAPQLPQAQITEALPESTAQQPMEPGDVLSAGKIARAGRFIAAPLKEAVFVSVGIADWLVENLWAMERECARRGERRTEAMRNLAAQTTAAASSRTADMYEDAREGMATVSEAVSSGVRKARTPAPVPQPT